MPHFDGRGFRINYVEQGEGPAVVFAHGYAMDHTMYAPQFEDIPDDHRCLAWDMRGHGDSDCPPGPWAMQDAVVDLIAFIEATNARPCHLVGMSWGGMIALRVGLQREDLVRSLVLIDTSADAEDPATAEVYEGFRAQIAADGLSEDLARSTLPIFYGERFLTEQVQAVEIHVERATSMPSEALAEGLRALIGRDSVVGRLGEIHVPTLVIHGEDDQAIPIAQAEVMASGIAGAELVRIPDCGHSSPLEAPDRVNQALAGFLAGL